MTGQSEFKMAGRTRDDAPPILPSARISDEDFELFSRLVYEKSGISLNLSKKEMLCSRLARIMRSRGFRSFSNYYEVVAADPTGEEGRALVSAISTNLTYFYREPAHFHYLENILIQSWIAENISGKRRRLRLWSAGCSTGEEPYSLAMSLHRCIPDLSEWDVRILAVDISRRVIETARTGRYDREKLSTVAPALKSRYLRDVQGSDGAVTVDGCLRDMVAFRELNLVQPVYPFAGSFDLILCRNVMIYFDRAMQERLLDNLTRHLHPGGVLFVGHVEVLDGLRHAFKFIAPGIYRKPPAA